MHLGASYVHGFLKALASKIPCELLKEHPITHDQAFESVLFAVRVSL